MKTPVVSHDAERQRGVKGQEAAGRSFLQLEEGGCEGTDDNLSDACLRGRRSFLV